MLQKKCANFGKLFVSWGAELQQDDCRFYGISYSYKPAQWAFFGLSVDTTEVRSFRVKDILNRVRELPERWRDLARHNVGAASLAALSFLFIRELETALKDPTAPLPTESLSSDSHN